MTEDEAAEFAEQVFDVARRGDAAMLAALLAKGLPVNLRNHNGDTLLMLSAYHGHAEAVKVLLEFKADPQIANYVNQLYQQNKAKDLRPGGDIWNAMKNSR